MRGSALKRGSVLTVFAAVAAIIAALLVPAASARQSARLHLSLIPLQMSSLGAAPSGLALTYDSGVTPNSVEREHAFFGAANLKALGRLRGYALHYGNEASGLPGVDSVWTSIDKFKNAKDARRGLEFWKHDDTLVSKLNGGGLSVTHVQVKVPMLGSARFGDLTSYSASNIAPISSFDEWLTHGRYLLNVRVAARTAGQAEQLGELYAKKLYARLKLALKGRLHAKPVELPAKPKRGPPPGGPDLRGMTLAPDDVSGQATTVAESYVPEPYGLQPDYMDLSRYIVAMNPAGPFDQLNQEIEWFATANEANFFADRWFAVNARERGVKALDLSGLGEGARGVYLNASSGGGAVVTFSTGQLAEVVQVDSENGVHVSDIMSIAQTAAHRINAAYSG